jgi:hypothetical protein
VKRIASFLFTLALTALVLLACSGDFESYGKVTGVRILAARADKPYAKPGDTVNLELLAFDGRAEKKEPMVVAWIPFLCTNPLQDAYYACFIPQVPDGGVPEGGFPALGADAGADGGGAPPAGQLGQFISQLRPGQDLTPFLPKGTKYSVRLPENIIDTHTPVAGRPEKYGLGIVFNVACAGRIRYVAFDPSKGIQQVPIECVDADGVPVSADNFVLGFTRIYAYQDETNQNPTVDKITFDGKELATSQVIQVDRCTTQRRSECPKIKVGVNVPDSSWELNPGDNDENGNTFREQIWASYFTTLGDFASDARLLFDNRQGRVSESEIEFQAPFEAGSGRIWIVVRDNRGGTVWSELPIVVK